MFTDGKGKRMQFRTLGKTGLKVSRWVWDWLNWYHKEIDVLIVGTATPQHMKDNIRFVENDPKLKLEVLETLYKRFEESGENWIQQT